MSYFKSFAKKEEDRIVDPTMFKNFTRMNTNSSTLYYSVVQ